MSSSSQSRWYWLLVPPIVLPLLTMLYNHDQPRLAGFPLFYWLQLAYIPFGTACVFVVYWRTRD